MTLPAPRPRRPNGLLLLRSLDHAARFLGVRLPWKARHRNPLVQAASGMRWWDRQDVTDDMIRSLLLKARSAYRHMAKQAHPDKGGSELEWRKVQTAWNTVRTKTSKHGHRL